MKSLVLLRVVCRDQGTAKKLASVLSADNRGFPSDQRMRMSVIARSIFFKVESERARSGLTTVCGILRDVALFQEIWLISRRKGR